MFFDYLLIQMLETDALCLKWFNLNVKNDLFSEDELKEKYRALSKENHPDLFPGDKQKSQNMLEINRAYDFLKHFVSDQMTDEERAFKCVLHNNNLETIRKILKTIMEILENDNISWAKGFRKTLTVIAEQTKQIYMIIIPLIVEIDKYLISYPNSQVSNFIIEELNKNINEEQLANLISKFYDAEHRYHYIWGCATGRYSDDYGYWSLGYSRANLQKRRNDLCHTFLKIARQLAEYIKFINNGTLSNEENSNLLLNIVYLKVYMNLQEEFYNIEHSGVYPCYLSAQEKENLKEKKIKKQQMLVYSKSEEQLERVRKKNNKAEYIE